jgi:hypothetical protein
MSGANARSGSVWPRMTRGAGLAVALLAVASAAAQQRTQHGAPQLELRGKRVEVPLKVVARHPIVEVTINGEGPLPFVLDTAAGLTVLDKALAKKLGLKSVGASHVGDASNSADRSAEIVTWDSIELGAARLTGGSAVVLDLERLFDAEPGYPRGILGISLFADCLLTLDYPGNRVVLEQGELPTPDGKNVLPCRFEPLPTIETQLSGRPLRLIIDSGAATCLTLAEDLKDQHKLKGEPAAIGIAKRLNSEDTIAEARADGELAIGSLRVREPLVNYSGARSVVGCDVLRHFAITLDARNQRIAFKGPDKPVAIPPRCHAGFGTKYADGQRSVRWVLAKSAAANAGVKEGDVIATVDGKACTAMDRGAWRARLETPGKMKLELKRGAEAIQTELEIVALVP